MKIISPAFFDFSHFFGKKIKKNGKKFPKFFFTKISFSEVKKAQKTMNFFLTFFPDFFQSFSKKMGKIKKGWGNDFHFFSFLSKILFPKNLLSLFFRQSQSVWVQV